MFLTYLPVMIYDHFQEFCILFQVQLSLLSFFQHHDAEILWLIHARVIFFLDVRICQCSYQLIFQDDSSHF